MDLNNWRRQLASCVCLLLSTVTWLASAQSFEEYLLKAFNPDDIECDEFISGNGFKSLVREGCATPCRMPAEFCQRDMSTPQEPLLTCVRPPRSCRFDGSSSGGGSGGSSGGSGGSSGGSGGSSGGSGGSSGGSGSSSGGPACESKPVIPRARSRCRRGDGRRRRVSKYIFDLKVKKCTRKSVLDCSKKKKRFPVWVHADVKACESSCGRRPVQTSGRRTRPRTRPNGPGSKTEHCKEPMQNLRSISKPCRKIRASNRYTWDGQRCRKFSYQGCRRKGNNFFTNIRKCLALCRPQRRG